MTLKLRCTLFTAAATCLQVLSFTQVKSQNIAYHREGNIILASNSDFERKPASVPSVQNKKVITQLPEAVVSAQMKRMDATIPMTYNKNTQNFINYFTVRDRRFVNNIWYRKHLYFSLYEEYLKNHGLPDELKYLSVIESSLNPRALSRVKAAGLWQFMSVTGKQYKLYQDAYIDERMDPSKATQAACLYLKDLHNMFGDWHLALAAYNCGPGNVRRAIRRSGNKKTFWQIYNFLPKETRAYVPKFIAITYVMKHAQAYNLTSDSLARSISADTILINQNLDMTRLAWHLDVPLEDLQVLNPQVRRDVIPGYLKNYSLRIPAEKKRFFTINREIILSAVSPIRRRGSATYLVSQIDALSANARRKKIIHTVNTSEPMSKVAQTYKVSVAELKKWNRLRSNTLIAGQKLAVWVNHNPIAPNMLVRNYNQTINKIKGVNSIKNPLMSPIKVHTVKPGDNLLNISQIYSGITLEKIKKLNSLTSNEVEVGQKLAIGYVSI